MPLTVDDVAKRARDILGDANKTRWTDPEAVRWTSDARREIATVSPKSFTKTTVSTPLAGTRQTFAGLNIADAASLVRVTRNVGADGVTPGRAVTMKPLGWIDERRPNWHADAAGEAQHAFYDPNDPKTFWLWPKADGSRKLEIVYAAVPAELTAITDAFGMDDNLATAAAYYLLARMGSKQKSALAIQAAAANYQLFLQLLGVRDSRLKLLDPNRLAAGNGSGVASADEGTTA